MSVFLLGLALAGKKAPEPSVDADALAAAETEACAQDIPENYRIFTGYASGPDAAQAKRDARAEAVKAALASLCSGKSDTRCEVLRRHVADWKTPFHNPVSQAACAHVGIDRIWIDDDQQAQKALTRAVQDLADAIVAAAPAGKPVALRAPVWGESGCDAGPLGIVVSSTIRNAFGAAQRKLVPVGSPSASEVHVVTRLAGDRVFVEATLKPWGSDSVLPIPGIDVAADLFPTDTADGASCWLDARLGLPGGQRDGKTGLMVRVDPQFRTAELCDGDASTPLVQVSQPARVKVYSIDRTGTAYLIWPPPGGSDLVQSTVSLGEMTYLPSPVGGEERLVAVAVPEGSRFAEVDGWTAFCKHPRPFDLTPWPEAAAASAALRVLPYDDPACIQRGVRRSPAMALPDVPICPQRLGG